MADYTEGQLELLQDALASGELEVTFNGRKTVYRSVSELKEAIAIVKQDLATAVTPGPVRSIRTYFNDETD